MNFLKICIIVFIDIILKCIDYFRCIIDGLNVSIVFNGYEFLKEMFYIFINYFVFGKKIWLYILDLLFFLNIY